MGGSRTSVLEVRGVWGEKGEVDGEEGKKKRYGVSRNRIRDLLHAKQALYQLSYNPINCLLEEATCPG